MLGLDTLFHKLLFGIIATVANIVDVIIDFIRMILGLSPLEGTDGVANILEDNLWTEVVLQAFGVVIAISVTLIFAFALIRLVRTHMAEKDEGGHWKAARGIVESIAMMFVIPLFAGVIILATSVTAQAIDTATRDSQGADIGYSTEVVFSTVDESMLTMTGHSWHDGENHFQIYDGYGNQITGMNAVKLVYGGWENGVNAEDKYYADAQLSVVLEPPLAGQSDFSRLTALVSEDAYFDTFILPMLGGFVMLCALAMAGITITQRIFSVIFLFIIAPIPASVRPLDDGARYKKWSEIFLGKVLGGYGIIFALNVFFSLCPFIVSQTFFYNAFANGVAKLIVYIAGVVFATGANVLIGQLIGADAGTAERDQASKNFRSAMSGAYWTGSAIRGARRMAGYPFGRGKSAKKNPSLAGGGGGDGLGGGGEKAPLGAKSGGTPSAGGEDAGGGGESAALAKAGSPAPDVGGSGGQSVSSRIGEAMSSRGSQFASRLGGMRVTRAAVGTAVAAAGVAVGGFFAGRAAWSNTFGRNTLGGLKYRSRHLDARLQKSSAAARASAERYRNASEADRVKMRPKLQKQLAKRSKLKNKLNKVNASLGAKQSQRDLKVLQRHEKQAQARRAAAKKK